MMAVRLDDPGKEDNVRSVYRSTGGKRWSWNWGIIMGREWGGQSLIGSVKKKKVGVQMLWEERRSGHVHIKLWGGKWSGSCMRKLLYCCQGGGGRRNQGEQSVFSGPCRAGCLLQLITSSISSPVPSHSLYQPCAGGTARRSRIQSALSLADNIHEIYRIYGLGNHEDYKSDIISLLLHCCKEGAIKNLRNSFCCARKKPCIVLCM